MIEQRQPVSRTGNGFVRGYPYPPSVFKNHHVSEIFSAKIRRLKDLEPNIVKQRSYTGFLAGSFLLSQDLLPLLGQ